MNQYYANSIVNTLVSFSLWFFQYFTHTHKHVNKVNRRPMNAFFQPFALWKVPFFEEFHSAAVFIIIANATQCSHYHLKLESMLSNQPNIQGVIKTTSYNSFLLLSTSSKEDHCTKNIKENIPNNFWITCTQKKNIKYLISQYFQIQNNFKHYQTPCMHGRLFYVTRITWPLIFSAFNIDFKRFVICTFFCLFHKIALNIKLEWIFVAFA